MALPQLPVPDHDTQRIIEKEIDKIEDWVSIARENKDDLFKVVGSFSVLSMAASTMTEWAERVAHTVIDPNLLDDELCEDCNNQHVNEDIVDAIDDFEDMLCQLIDTMSEARLVARRNAQKDGE